MNNNVPVIRLVSRDDLDESKPSIRMREDGRTG